MRLCGQVHTIYLGRWGALADEHEAIIQERREWRAARRAERQAAAEELAEVRERVELVESVTTACLAAVGYHRPKRYRWRRARMIQIEHDTGDLIREASDLVKAIYDAPKPAAAGPSMARLREIARLSPAAVVGATNGDLFRFSMGLVTRALTTNPKTGRRSPLGISIEARLMEVLTSLTGDNPSPALRLAAESATYAYLEHWLSNLSAAMARADDEAIHPALDRRQTFTQRRFLRALSTVEEIQALTRPKRIAMEI